MQNDFSIIVSCNYCQNLSQGMYDTANFWLPKEKIGKRNFLDKVPMKLTGITEHKKEGQVYESGYLDNYNVNISANGISFKGSLAKYAQGNNFETLNREGCKRAIEKLSDEIKLPVKKATVRRIDFAANLKVTHRPEAFYNDLGTCSHYKRFVQPNSLYYKNGYRTLCFYDKVKEAKSKRIPIPEIWSKENVLRYELRFTSRLPYQFNLPEVTASLLYNRTFYNSMGDRWEHEYFAISKQKHCTPQITKPMTAVESQKILFALLYSEKQNKVMQIVEQWNRQNIFSSKREYYRVKHEMRKLVEKLPEGENSLITELDENVKAAKLLYR